MCRHTTGAPARARAGLLALAAVAVLCALPSAASAASVSKQGSLIRYVGTNADNDSVAISVEGGTIQFRDRSLRSIVPSQGCVSSGNVAACVLGSASDVQVELGNGTNRISSSAADARIRSIEFRGGSGIDLFDGSAAAERYLGLGGNDVFKPVKGSDRIEGGTGTDRVDYTIRGVDFSLSLDGQANDGSEGERANVLPDIEQVIGGSGSDTLTGTAAGNLLSGGNGNDKISGLSGDDQLLGGEGDDRVSGDAGADSVVGDAGRDNLIGGEDADALAAGNGDDFLTGGRGPDKLNGGAGADAASYLERTAPVHIDFEGDADDGEVGEGDLVDTSVEDAFGGDGPDALIGDDNANSLFGSDGDDSLVAGNGDDVLEGGRGRDLLHAGPGADEVTADSKRGGDDTSADLIHVRDGRIDTVNCGTLIGTFDADRAENTVGCGRGELPDEGEETESPRVAVSTGTVPLTRSGVAAVPLRCAAPAGERCRGVLRLRARLSGKSRTVAKGRYVMRRGRKKVVRLRLTMTARRAVRRKGSVRALVTATPPKGSKLKPSSRQVRIVRARR